MCIRIPSQKCFSTPYGTFDNVRRVLIELMCVRGRMEGGKEKGVDEEGGYSDIYFVETKDIANYLIITKYKKKKNKF